MLRNAGRFAGKVTFKLSKMVVKAGWKTGKTVARTGIYAGKLTARKGLRTGKQAVKSAINKANPIAKPVNKNDVADHGVESLRMANTAYKTGKRTIKTAKTTIQTKL